METTHKNDGKKYFETLHRFVGPVLFIWLLYCFASTFMINLENQLDFKAQASQKFKSNCVTNKGTVRHGVPFFNLDIYCVQEDGNETAFYPPYPENMPALVSFDIVLASFDKSTFGLFELNR